MPKGRVIKPKQPDTDKLNADVAKSVAQPKSAARKVAKVVKPLGKKTK